MESEIVLQKGVQVRKKQNFQFWIVDNQMKDNNEAYWIFLGAKVKERRAADRQSKPKLFFTEIFQKATVRF